MIFNPYTLTKQNPNHLGYGGIDRKSELREDLNYVTKLLKINTTKIVPLFKNKNFFLNSKDSSKVPEPGFISASNIKPYLKNLECFVFLGQKLEGNQIISYLAADFSLLDENLILSKIKENGFFLDLREINPLINGDNASLLAYARAMIYWHNQNQYCSNCGSKNISSKAGHQKTCSNLKCKTSCFPRSDPAVIMLIHKDNKVLLGRQSIWPSGMYSTLAGFVEPGETIEHAVAREVYEESGIITKNIVYHSSQPWPFHTSLMLGFFGEATNDKIIINEEEIEDVQWFSRDELLNFSQQSKSLPRKLSISRRLIEDWIHL